MPVSERTVLLLGLKKKAKEICFKQFTMIELGFNHIPVTNIRFLKKIPEISRCFRQIKARFDSDFKPCRFR